MGASGVSTIAGESSLPAKASYFRGSDSSKWIVGAPEFEKVRTREIQAGVDLLCYANEKQFEYDLIVKPGAKPADVRLRFAGAVKTSLTPEGDLKIETAAGDLIQHKPRIWQESSSGKTEIAGGYKVWKTGEISIDVGPYDLARELVIDPVITYSTYFGGSGADQISAIAVDASGNLYITGQTPSADFPTTIGAYSVAENTNSTDVFVSKLNPSGSGLVYSTYLGGSSTDMGNGIAIDPSGNAYVTGSTASLDFPVTTGAFQKTRQAVAEVT